MFKVTWVQMSQCMCGWESERNCHIVEGISALPQASINVRFEKKECFTYKSTFVNVIHIQRGLQMQPNAMKMKEYD